MQQLNWQYPSWYLLFCLILGIAAAVFLYRRDKTFADQPEFLRYLMAFLRGFVVAALSFLLLAPLLKYFQTRTEPPIIVLAQDQSTSVDGIFSKDDSTAYVNALQDLKSRLEQKYIVHTLGFGEKVEPTDAWVFDDQASDLGELMTYLREQYKGQNVGAVIIASDGAVNRGRNPLYVSADQKAPVSVIALGDTTRKTDLQIREVFHNSIAYLGDKFSVQVDLSAARLQGATTALEVRHLKGNENILLQRIPVSIDADPWFQTREIILEADQSGVQRYRFQLTQVRDEVSYANNIRDFFVEVIDGRLKVLLLAHSPHPDLAVWKNALLAQKNYEVEVMMASDITPAKLGGYDLVVLHQLPSSKYPLRLIFDEIRRLSIPKVFIAGGQTDLNAFNQAQNLLQIDFGSNRTPNEVTIVPNPGFTSFKITDDLKTKIASFSPLSSPYGEYLPSPSAQILAYQKIGRVDTQFPLILMGESQDIRTVVVAGEGMWKWQLYDQLQNGSREITHELISQLCQYASTKSDKRKFRVTPSKKLFTELEDISFQAELYNDNYEPVNTPEVTIRILNAEKQAFDYTFNSAGSAYVLNVGRFPEGRYTYSAQAELNGVRQTADGQFVVQPVRLESLTSTADHGLLRQLASQQGGSFLYPGQMTQLADQILANDAIKPVMFSSMQTKPLIHLKWVCLILLGALCLEWFLRRYYGGY